MSVSCLRELAEKYPESEYATYAKALLAERLGKLGDAQVLAGRIADTRDRYLMGRVQLLTGRLGALR